MAGDHRKATIISAGRRGLGAKLVTRFVDRQYAVATLNKTISEAADRPENSAWAFGASRRSPMSCTF